MRWRLVQGKPKLWQYQRVFNRYRRLGFPVVVGLAPYLLHPLSPQWAPPAKWRKIGCTIFTIFFICFEANLSNLICFIFACFGIFAKTIYSHHSFHIRFKLFAQIHIQIFNFIQKIHVAGNICFRANIWLRFSHTG